MKNIFFQSSFENIEPCNFYLGIDPTSETLHVGHYYLFKVCDYLINNGFKMFLLIGDNTAMIGDPTDKKSSRKLLSKEEIDINIKSILNQIPKLDYTIVYNSKFEFNIQDLSKISTNYLLTNRTFSERLSKNEHLSLLEFIYPSIQALDFYNLNKLHNVTLQIGGKDQWFNMVTGKNLIKNVNIATLPLLTSKKGLKIGKTENIQEFNSYSCWQFFRNIKDEEVLPILNSITNNYDIKEDINNLKIILSDIMTEFIFGNDELMKVKLEISKKYK